MLSASDATGSIFDERKERPKTAEKKGMARFCSLFSSSSGNATFLGTAKSGVLIDAGVSAKRLTQSLADRQIDIGSLQGIFVTHEHSDHIKGIRVFASRYHIPVYATEGTLVGLEEAGVLCGNFPVHVIEKSGIEVGDMLIKPFETPHDSNESCGYTVAFPDERKAAVATDIGHMTNEIMNALIGCDLVMLESNHDIGMLENGDYPYYLKRRILSARGHLSNEACADAAAQLVERGTTRLFLGHLSAENNIPDLAFQTSYASIFETGAVLDRDYTLKVNARENLEDIVRF